MPDSSTTRRNVISPHCPRTPGPAQRGHQVARLARQQILAGRQHVHLRLDGGKGIDAVALDGLDLRFGLCQRLADGFYQRLDRGFAFLQYLRGVLLLAGQAFARKIQEHFVVALQALARQFAEHALQLLAGAGRGLLAFRAQASPRF